MSEIPPHMGVVKTCGTLAVVFSLWPKNPQMKQKAKSFFFHIRGIWGGGSTV